ncbi:MAG: hypothetical protein QM726_21770 [Chitinophagaceae bacterium]
MKWALILIMLFSVNICFGQSKAFTPEDFVNAISRQVVDSSISSFYLYAKAPACSFKRFDYDEWYKYGLQQDVPIYVLQELAKQSYQDTLAHEWRQDKLQHTNCIDDATAKLLLSDAGNKHVSQRKPKFNKSEWVYYFSRPAFTEDNQYAVIDIGYRCDNLQCGMGATFIFKQTDGKWAIVGRKQAWGN